jgi:DNA-binding NarL/FixJ family response regulator
MEPIQVLLVDDEPKVLRGLRMRLNVEPDISVVGEASDGSTAIDMARLLMPNVIVMDVSMPVMDGIAATRELVSRIPAVAVVILSLHDDHATIENALAAGAAAFVAKRELDGELLAAIRQAAQGTKGGALTNATDPIARITREEQA